jgi:uncharacterized protein with PQ loop repeat
VFELIGLAGIAISVLAYLPQVVHLGREHCSAGVSSRAWAMWLASSVLVGALAVHRRDPVFIVLQLSTMTWAAVIVFLAHRYRGMVCEAHSHVSATRVEAQRSDTMAEPLRGADAPRARGAEADRRGVWLETDRPRACHHPPRDPPPPAPAVTTALRSEHGVAIGPTCGPDPIGTRERVDDPGDAYPASSWRFYGRSDPDAH